MTWTKLSDDFTDDCWTLSDEAFRLHVEGLVWSNRKLLDLRIPKSDVRRFAKSPAALAELLAVGWWTDDSDYYVIRHHARYQRLKDDVLKQQRANAENGKKGGRPKKPTREVWHSQETQSVSEPLSESRTERDRTGQALKNTRVCAHEVPNGDQPDSWLNGRLTCSECAAELIEAAS